MAGRRRALITNDDGIDSEGIRVLGRAACAEGLEVTVAAPSWDASGSSAAMAAVQTGGRVLWTERRDPDLAARLLAVEAAPAFIVRAAVHGELGPPPELVLSGINHGLNVGRSIIHSGTVGAALTAGLYGLPAAAFSFDATVDDAGPADPGSSGAGSVGPGSAGAGPGGGALHWDTAAFVVRTVLGWLEGDGDPVVLNVNIPNVAGEALGGLQPAALAPVGTARTTVTELGGSRRRGPAGPGEAGAGPGPAVDPTATDSALVAAGAACYTPLRGVGEDARFRSFPPPGSGGTSDATPGGARGRDGGHRAGRE